MCRMDIDITLLSAIIYAVDENGICHIFENKNSDPLTNIEEKMDAKSIVILSNQMDNSLQLSNKDLIQNSSSEYLSTQPFSILDLHENTLSSLHLFDNDTPTPILSPPVQLSGHIATQYQNNYLINSIKKKKKYFPSRRLSVLKKRLKAYLKKKKKKQKKHISNVIIHPQSHQIESTPIDHSTMIDIQFSPDLSKRKYIYKDITLSNNNQNQMNWRIFQCTQQSSSISCFDQSVANGSYHPFYFTNNQISLPDIRIGLSRHHGTKQLHKTIID